MERRRRRRRRRMRVVEKGWNGMFGERRRRLV